MTVLYRYEKPSTEVEPENLPIRWRVSVILTVIFAGVCVLSTVGLLVTRSFESAVCRVLESRSEESVESLKRFRNIPSPLLNHDLTSSAIILARLNSNDGCADAIKESELRRSEIEARFIEAVDSSNQSLRHNDNSVRINLEWACSILGGNHDVVERWQKQSATLNSSSLDITKPASIGEISYVEDGVEFQVFDKDHQQIDGLSSVDFALLDAHSRFWPHFEVSAVTSRKDESSTVLLLDCSSSMEGSKIDQLKRASSQFLDALKNQSATKIVAFSSDVTPLTSFNSEIATQKSAIEKVKAYGATELAAALEFAITDLAQRPGKRFVVVCTDGSDPKLAGRLATIRAKGVANHVQISGLAINDRSLDLSTLKELASATGGSVIRVDDPSSFSSSMMQFAANQTKPNYRMKIFAPGVDLQQFRPIFFHQWSE